MVCAGEGRRTRARRATTACRHGGTPTHGPGERRRPRARRATTSCRAAEPGARALAATLGGPGLIADGPRRQRSAACHSGGDIISTVPCGHRSSERERERKERGREEERSERCRPAIASRAQCTRLPPPLLAFWSCKCRAEPLLKPLPSSPADDRGACRSAGASSCEGCVRYRGAVQILIAQVEL